MEGLHDGWKEIGVPSSEGGDRGGVPIFSLVSDVICHAFRPPFGTRALAFPHQANRSLDTASLISSSVCVLRGGIRSHLRFDLSSRRFPLAVANPFPAS